MVERAFGDAPWAQTGDPHAARQARLQRPAVLVANWSARGSGYCQGTRLSGKFAATAPIYAGETRYLRFDQVKPPKGGGGVVWGGAKRPLDGDWGSSRTVTG